MRKRGKIDLAAGLEVLGIPDVDVWDESDIRTMDAPPNSRTLAAWHSPHCGCGRPSGISIDLEAIVAAGQDPNEVLLHELVHVWQYHLDPEGSAAKHAAYTALFGYWDAPHEVEARTLAGLMHDAGIRVWFD